MPKVRFPVEGSVQPDGIVCLFDGQKRVMLNRYLKSEYNMTPDEYREVCGLPDDYPMTASGYRDEKRRLAARDGGALPEDGGKPAKTKRPKAIDDVEHRDPSPEFPVNPPIVRGFEGSVTAAKIFCLLDGKGYQFLGPVVLEKYGMTWKQYLAYCGLPADYPSVAPIYGGGDKYLGR